MEIDIRKEEVDEIDKIRICDRDYCTVVVEALTMSWCTPYFEDSDNECRLYILSKEHALNIKKAIDKAIELGWWD